MENNTTKPPKGNRRNYAKTLTNSQRDLILSKTIEVADDAHANNDNRIVACLIGLMLTTGLRLAEIISLMVDSIESRFCEETNRMGYFLKYTAAKSVREQYCSDTSAKFFNVAKEIHDSDKRLAHDSHLFVMYNARSQSPTWISASLFEHYYQRFHKKYLQELTDDNGCPMMPTAHQYRQTYLRSQLDFQQRRYQSGGSQPESEYDEFEKLVFK